MNQMAATSACSQPSLSRTGFRDVHEVPSRYNWNQSSGEDMDYPEDWFHSGVTLGEYPYGSVSVCRGFPTVDERMAFVQSAQTSWSP